MTPFKKIPATAAKRAGGEAQLKKLLPQAKSAKALKSVSDDRYLSMMSLRVFSAGLKYSMVKGKWPAFEEVFPGFDPKRVRAMSDESLEGLLNEKPIIRHWGKIKATRVNAAAMCDIADEAGNFSSWLSAWPADDCLGLWDALTKRFTQLGGFSGPFFLRMAGKDTFMLSPDVGKALNKWGGYHGEIKGKKAALGAQDALNAAAESKLPLRQISRILAMSVD
jgi:3-methyladenine DNA glycosylase Tag